MRAVPHTIPQDIFAILLSYWREQNMGDTWSIGNIKYLIKKKPIRYHLAWRQSYFESSKQRNEILSTMTGDMQAIANNIHLSQEEIVQHISQNRDIKLANYYSGRSNEQVKAKSVAMHKMVRKDGYNIELSHCSKFVFYNTLGVSWNDYVKEQSSILALKELCPELTFRNIDADVYDQYAIDIILYHRKEMICGIHFENDSNYNIDIRSNTALNQKKNAAFTTKYDTLIYNIKTSLLLDKDVPIIHNINQLIKA